MMNALALGLVLTSLVTAGFFNPTSTETQKPPADDVIVKDGHRVVVVEFEKDDKHTKVLISPPEPEKIITDDSAQSSKTDQAEEDDETKTHPGGFKPRELICDALGKCKHKIASAFEKKKDEVEGETEKVKDAVSETAHQVFDKMRDSAGEIKQGAEKVKEKALEKVEDAKRSKGEIGEILHRGRDVGVDVLHYAFSPERLAGLSGVLHLMGFSAAYGMCLWVTFASSSVLAVALPRNQFAVVQSRIYPVYFKAMAYTVGMAILGHLMGRGPKSGVGVFQGLNLVASLGMVLVNLLCLEPRASKVMRERMKLEKEEGRGKEGHVVVTEASEDRGGLSTAEIGGRLEKQQEEIAAAAKAKSEMLRLSEKLQKLNSYSSFLNVFTLMSLTGHLVHLGQRVHLACV